MLENKTGFHNTQVGLKEGQTPYYRDVPQGLGEISQQYVVAEISSFTVELLTIMGRAFELMHYSHFSESELGNEK